VTQYRKHKDAISNYFDTLEDGIGKRGSSFTDFDGVSHDRNGNRFLIREFKEEEEKLEDAQWQALHGIATKRNCTVWILRRMKSGKIQFQQCGANGIAQIISEDEYKELVKLWWYPP